MSPDPQGNDEGTGFAGFEGFAPEIRHGTGNPEALKYGELWKHPEYRQVAPGEELAQVFLTVARPMARAQVIDFGCGTGRGALMLAVLGRLRVTLVDFVRNCLDPEIVQMLETQADTLRFVKADLSAAIPVVAEYGFCTDVMEHIPPEQVERTLGNILRAARHVFFSIALTPDTCGALIGQPLHLTVEPATWWIDVLQRLGAVIHWSKASDKGLLVYCSAWTNGADLVKAGQLNVPDETIQQNVAKNITAGWQQVVPHVTNDKEVILLGGGPSLNASEGQIRLLRAGKAILVTLNGSYHWAIERGLRPSGQIVVDARPFNARFTHPVIEDCHYLIGSQVDPLVLAGLPPKRTWLWHSNGEEIQDILRAHYGPGGYYIVPGGSTVLFRAIPLLRLLGYRRFHLFGCDSCIRPIRDNETCLVDPTEAYAHHAYEQPENDGGLLIPVEWAGRMFWCYPWMASQATQMVDLIRMMGDEIELAIYGDGLLAWMLTHAATDAAIPTNERPHPEATVPPLQNHPAT